MKRERLYNANWEQQKIVCGTMVENQLNFVDDEYQEYLENLSEKEYKQFIDKIIEDIWDGGVAFETFDDCVTELVDIELRDKI